MDLMQRRRELLMMGGEIVLPWITYQITVPSATRTVWSGGANTVERMIIDGVEVTPTSSYTFDTYGATVRADIEVLLFDPTEIPMGAFNAAHYRDVTLPDTVTSIGVNAFRNFTSNVSSWLRCLATTPPTLSGSVFANSRNISIYVPDASVSAYKAAWTEVSDKIYSLSDF